MVTRPSWEEIYGRDIPHDLPPVPRNATPLVDAPECPRDCSGRHHTDSFIACQSCGVPAYKDVAHEYRVNRGVNFHVLEPMNGAPPLLSAHMPCPACGGVFRK